MSTIEMQTREAARPVPVRVPIEGPSAWIGADMRGREAEWTLSPVAAGDRRDRGRGAGGAGARSRYRRDPPRGLPAADARAGAGPAARRGAGRPRLCAVARHAGRRSADRRERDGLLGHRHLFRQRPLAERARGICSGMSTTSAGLQRDQPQSAQLCDGGTPEFPYRPLRRRRAACACGAPNRAGCRRSSAR